MLGSGYARLACVMELTGDDESLSEITPTVLFSFFFFFLSCSDPFIQQVLQRSFSHLPKV